MTAAICQTVRIYTVKFEGCTTKLGFLMRLARAFGIEAAKLVKGQVWQAFCEEISSLAADELPVCVRLTGIDEAYESLPAECEALLGKLRWANNKCSAFRAEAYVGNMRWKV